jgi:hypothetical protein
MERSMPNEESEVVVPQPTEWSEPAGWPSQWQHFFPPPLLGEDANGRPTGRAEGTGKVVVTRKSGDLFEKAGPIVACTKRDKGKFYPPYQPQTWLASQALPDPLIAKVVKVRLLAENWFGPNWLEEGGDPDHMVYGGNLAWGQWIKATQAQWQIGGKVATVWAGLFFNQSDTRERLVAINVVCQYL